MSNEFKIENIIKDLKSLIDEFKNHEDFKYHPRSGIERIIARLTIGVNNKKQPLSSIAHVTHESINNKNILNVSPFEKIFLRPIESALLEECNHGFGERVEKDNASLIFYLPSIITQSHIDNIVAKLLKPICDSYLHNKLKDIRSKYQDMIKPLQTKQRDMFNKYRDQIDTESQKYTKQIQEFISSVEKKYNIKI